MLYRLFSLVCSKTFHFSVSVDSRLFKIALSLARTSAQAATDPVAASYSMKPASIPSMTLPSTAIPAATAAQKWIEDRWGHVTGKSEYIAFVEDPYDAGNKEYVLRVNYPKGSYAHSDVGEGGVGMYLNPFGSGVQRAMFTYEVAFSKGWDFVEGVCILRDASRGSAEFPPAQGGNFLDCLVGG